MLAAAPALAAESGPNAPSPATPPTSNAKIDALQVKLDDINHKISALTPGQIPGGVITRGMRLQTQAERLQVRMVMPGLLASRTALAQQITRERAALAAPPVTTTSHPTVSVGAREPGRGIVVTSYGVSTVGAGVARSRAQENAALWGAAGTPPRPRTTTSNLRQLYLRGGPAAIGSGQHFGR